MKITIPSVFLLAFLFAFSGQTFAARFIVDTRGDNGRGRCNEYGFECTLRDAVIAANNLSSDDTITFDPTLFNTNNNTFTLNSELVINNAGTLTINGLGVNGLTIDGGAGANRIFYVNGATVTFQNLTLTGGNGLGAAISTENNGNVNLESVVVKDNAGDGASGAIYLLGGTNHRITNSTISGNAGFGDCAAVYAYDAILTVTNSTFSGNSTIANSGGAGAICAVGSTSSIIRSTTISGNTANGAFSFGGGGIFINNTARVDLGNTIVAGNTSANRGPDLFRFSGAATFTSSGGNIIGDNSGSQTNPNTTAFPAGNPNQNGDRVGTAGAAIDPRLAPLANNGGATLTRALLANSPAIDAGKNSLGGLPTDQRGAARIQDGNSDGTATIDSGAYEFPAVLTVTRSDDRNNATCVLGDCSLREAINAANAFPDPDVIKFAAELSGQTILLSPTLGQLQITGSLTIDAAAAANLSVSGGGAISVFGIPQTSATVVLTGFRITGGNGRSGIGNGGAIKNRGDLTLNSMVIQGNEASYGGGGIASDSDSSNLGNRLTINGGSISNNAARAGAAIFGFLTVIKLTNVTISDNSALFNGGGIYLTGGNLNITGGSVTGNTAALNNGGGIATYNSTVDQDNRPTYYDSVVTITNASIANNRSLPDANNFDGNKGNAQGNGGGIYMEGAAFTMINSTVSGNYGLVSGGGISMRGGGTYNIAGTTLSGNSTGSDSSAHTCLGGGALFSRETNVTISNSTISGNLSRAFKSSLGDNGGGGGISIVGGLFLRNVTIAYNRAPNGPGGGINTVAENSLPGTVTMSNTIVANNSNVNDNGFINYYAFNPDVSGNVVSEGFNLVRTRGGSVGYVASDLPDGSNPLLEALANNGGLTQTHRLLAGSQAIDRGSNQLAVNTFNNTALTTDQRGAGFARIRDGNLDGTATVDIGAFEVQTGAIQPPDLTALKSHAGNFAQGQTGARYTIIVSNNGGSATSGTVSVTDALPNGLTATAISGTGWTCSLGTLTCTRSDALAVGASYPAITLTVNVATTAPASVINRATVSGGGEANSENNTASDATTINGVADLTVAKSHAGNFTRGDTGKTYSITVSNSGGAATSGTVSMVDTLPSGLTATAISGSGWTCNLGTLTCTRSDALAVNGSYPVITLTVSVTNDAPGSVTNIATVSGGGETNTANNTANDATIVFSAASYTISGRITNGGQALFGVTVTVSGGAATTTDAAGVYSFTNLAQGGNYTVTPSLSGYNFAPPSLTFNNLSANQSNADFSTAAVSYEGDLATRPGGDGFINNLDVTAVSRIIALLDAQPANGSEFQRSDAAPRTTLGDGSIDVLDLVQTGRYFANLDPLTPAGGFTAAQTAAASGAAATATVSAGSVSASTTAATVPIRLTTSGDVEAIQFSIVYNQTKLAVPANLTTAFINRYPNATFTFNTATAGRISVVAHQPLDGVSAFPAGTVALFDINFTIIGTPVGTTSIGFGNSPIPQRASDPNANLITVAATAGTLAFAEQNHQVVNTLADHDDGVCNATDCTLREAVKYVTAGGNVSFNVNGTITLPGGEIAIAKNLTITGPAGASGITVSGNNASRIFTITGSSTVVEFAALKLIGGNGVGTVASGNGGAIFIELATVRLTNSTLSGNSVTGNGGAVRSSGNLTVTNSTISGNTAGTTGGAIRTGGTLNLTNSTVSGNNAPSGGGIYINGGTINLTGASVAYNTASTSGGGFFNNGGTTNLLNTLIAKNTNSAAPDFSGAIAPGSTFNLIGDGTGMTGITNDPAAANQVGTSATPIDPKLDPTLALNGGATQTHALLVNSPAIDAGNATGTDQRGLTRPSDNPSIPNAANGNGADIGAFEVQTAPPASAADLTVVKSHAGNFTQGDTGKTYSITVSNNGSGATSGTVSAVDTLPSGLTATAITGSGWTCNLGTLTCTRSDALAANGNYPAITLTVNVANNAPSSVTNTATVSGGGETNTANNTADDATTVNSAATYSIGGTVGYGTTPSASPAKFVPGVSVNAAGSSSVSALTGGTGNYSLANLIAGGNYTTMPAKSGDVNGISSFDASLAARRAANAVTLTPNQMIAADASNNDAVTSFDASLIARTAAGISNTGIAGQWRFAPVSRSYPNLTASQTGQNYDAILIGEVSGNWTAPTATTAGARVESMSDDEQTEADRKEEQAFEETQKLFGLNLPTDADRQSEQKTDGGGTEQSQSAQQVTGAVSLPTNSNASKGSTVIVPVTVGDTTGARIFSFDFTVAFDPNVLQLADSSFDQTGTVAAGFTITPNPGAGQLTISGFGTQALSGAGTLLNLRFTVVGTAGTATGATALTFGSFVFNEGDPMAAATDGRFSVTGPTAAGVSVAGRVTTSAGTGIRNVAVTMTDMHGNIKTVRTSSFGHYRFTDVRAGETYILSAAAKRYTFSQPSQVLNVNEDTDEVDFVADSGNRSKDF